MINEIIELKLSSLKVKDLIKEYEEKINRIIKDKDSNSSLLIAQIDDKKKKHDDQIKALTIENKNVIESMGKIREQNEKKNQDYLKQINSLQKQLENDNQSYIKEIDKIKKDEMIVKQSLKKMIERNNNQAKEYIIKIEYLKVKAQEKEISIDKSSKTAAILIITIEDKDKIINELNITLNKIKQELQFQTKRN